MTRIERKIATRTLLLGSVLTCLVAGLGGLGGLAPLERWIYDIRARYAQFFMPPPTDGIVHLGINDDALEAIGHWPWGRDTLAELLEEIDRAGAEVIALDVLLSEPSGRGSGRAGGGGGGGGEAAGPDRVLAQTMERLGNVLLPLHFEIAAPPAPREAALAARLREDLELTPAAAFAQMEGPVDEDLFVACRRRAMFDRVLAAMEGGVESAEALADRLLPGERARGVTGSPLRRLLERQWARARALGALRGLARPADPDLPPMLPGTDVLPPVPALARASALTGFVSYPRGRDGVLRTVPLWYEHRGWLYPQMALALASRMRGHEPGAIRIEADRLVLPATGRAPARVVPVHASYSATAGRRVSGLMDVPWFGPARRWELMYDPPAYRRPRQHLPILEVWKVRELRRRIVRNNANAAEAIKAIWEVADPDRLRELEEADPPPGDRAAWRHWIERTRSAEGPRMFREMFAGMSEAERAELSESERILERSLEAVWAIAEQNPALAASLAEARAALEEALAGRAVLIGWVATGSVADVVPTSLHAHAPGVVVHGVLYNAFMTGELWRRAPAGWTLGLTAILGLAATLLTGLLPPLRALGGILGLGAGYLLVNAIVIFDYGNLVLEAAPPLVAIGAVWSGGTVHRLALERAEKARITRRFQSYVDPALVRYVLEHPEQVLLEGLERELTVVFTDIAGFTALSEQLRERTVLMLNDYLSLMVPVIRRHGGYVNKFLGDGMMFFYGAPESDPAHAVHALATVLQMQALMGPFNQRLRERGLPTVSKRVGVSSGRMIVGDAGSPDASDYTVLGDVVNLGARLESANKATGTRILVNARTEALTRHAFLLRPVGRLRVVGKQEGVMTYEPLAPLDEAGAAERERAERSREVVALFAAGEFEACLAACDRLETHFDGDGLAAFYRRLASRYRQDPPGADWDGGIVLESK